MSVDDEYVHCVSITLVINSIHACGARATMCLKLFHDVRMCLQTNEVVGEILHTASSEEHGLLPSPTTAYSRPSYHLKDFVKFFGRAKPSCEGYKLVRAAISTFWYAV